MRQCKRQRFIEEIWFLMSGVSQRDDLFDLFDFCFLFDTVFACFTAKTPPKTPF
jgi:hypothetical protein